MLSRKPSKPAYDPEEELVGRCATCHSAVAILAKLAVAPPRDRIVGKDPGTWSDLYYTACPHCQARVYLMPKKEG